MTLYVLIGVRDQMYIQKGMNYMTNMRYHCAFVLYLYGIIVRF